MISRTFYIMFFVSVSSFSLESAAVSTHGSSGHAVSESTPTALSRGSCNGKSVDCAGQGCGGRSGYITYQNADTCETVFDNSAACYYQKGVCGGSGSDGGCQSYDVVQCPGMGCGGRAAYESYEYANECESTFDSSAGCYYHKGICTK